MLNTILKNKKIILASGSPRRQQFLKDMGVEFEIRLKPVEEIFPDNLKASEITDYLALLKASAFDGTLKENEILITSDTIVWHENKALGKPADRQHAFDMIASMSAKTHEVITSVCFATRDTKETISDITKVHFSALTEAEIYYYIDHFSPFDKAGAYGIQEWIGQVGITAIEGSYFNVAGFPVHLVYKKLMTLGN